MQRDFFGNEHAVESVRDQLREIMLDDPRTIDDEDLLAAEWVTRYVEWKGVYPPSVAHLRYILRSVRKADIPRRRRELRDEFPYGEGEEVRRQKAGRQ